MAKVKVATEWLAGCAGCHMSFLDMDERLVALTEFIEIVSGPLVDAKHVPEVDVAIVEGGIANSSNLENLKELRAKAKILIAIGDCALYGGVPAMRNIVGKEAALKHAYCESPNCFGCGIPNDPELAVLEDKVTGLDAHVKVDAYIPGCPPSADAIYTALSELLAGRIPALTGDVLKYD
jgi:NAD-reducing hydrogenase small subunit